MVNSLNLPGTMILRIIVIGCCLLVVFGSCRTQRATAGEKAPSGADTAACPAGEGIRGMVRVVSGNQMPAPGVKRGPLRGVRSTVYVFELTNINQVTRQGQSPYYQSVQTRLLATVDTDSTGHFLICLPAGRYSLFTRKNGMYYASRRDVDNNIAPVEVTPGKMTQAECRIEGDHPPVY